MAEKPIFVHHNGRWRPYLGSRSLLLRTSIGDVIPVLEAPLCEDAAKLYVHSRDDAGADLVSVATPTEMLWQLLDALVKNPTDTFSYPNPFA